LLKALNELISANGFDFTAIQETWCFMTMNARRKERIYRNKNKRSIFCTRNTLFNILCRNELRVYHQSALSAQ